MERLLNDTSFIEHNTDLKAVKKKKPLFREGYLIYRLDVLFKAETRDGDDLSIYKAKLFSLESLRYIISIVESKLRSNIRHDFIFYSDDIIFMSDNLTVSLTEYVVAYYKQEYGINIFIADRKTEGNKVSFGSTDEDHRIYGGFLVQEIVNGFLLDSLLLIEDPEKENPAGDDIFYCRRNDSNRYKITAGTGPWDASMAVSQCTEFLERSGISDEAIETVAGVLGELAPNAVEHGKSNCMIDVSYNEFIDKQGELEMGISIVIYNFSDKLLWTDLYSKVFEDYKEITYFRDRVDTVRDAWGNHSREFSRKYSEKDFYNLMAFQSISGRKGDNSDGGLGIRTLVRNVQEYSSVDYCYVLSGNNCLMLRKDFTVPDKHNYVAFNTTQQYVEKIPDKNAVGHTKCFIPGVAYNLLFCFKKDS